MMENSKEQLAQLFLFRDPQANPEDAKDQTILLRA